MGFVNFTWRTQLQDFAEVSVNMVHHDEHRVQILDGGIKWYYQID